MVKAVKQFIEERKELKRRKRNKKAIWAEIDRQLSEGKEVL